MTEGTETKNNDDEIHKANMDLLVYGSGAYKTENGVVTHIPVTEIYKTPKELASDYLKRMGVEPDASAIASWILNSFRNGIEDDYYCIKYGRRMIDALITICGGNPNAD